MSTNYMDLPFFGKSYKDLWSKIEMLHYLPSYDYIFQAFFQPRSTKSTRVLILGQDPYPTPGHANGLAFSVKKSVTPLPRSLKNIFKELVDDIRCPPPRSGDLTPWTEQGVLLLNTCLTTEPYKPNAHKGWGWEKLAEEVVSVLSDETKGRVFILWGRQAQAYEKFIDQDKHLVIKSAHPSPLSANYGFFGSKPFSKANAYLGKRAIDWSLENQPVPPVKLKKQQQPMYNLDELLSVDYPTTQDSGQYQWATTATTFSTRST